MQCYYATQYLSGNFRVIAINTTKYDQGMFLIAGMVGRSMFALKPWTGVVIRVKRAGLALLFPNK